MEEDPSLEVTGWADNINDAREQISLQYPDLLFLDIRLNHENGFNLMESIGRHLSTIFIDTDSSQALRTFSYNAIDLLVKPLSAISISRCLDKFNLWNSILTQNILAERSPSTLLYPKRILVENGGRRKSLQTESILYFKADRDYTRILDVHNEMYISTNGISELEKRLDPSQFIRIHRSYIINADHIKELYRDISKTYVLLQNNIELSVSRRYMVNLKEMVF